MKRKLLSLFLILALLLPLLAFPTSAAADPAGRWFSSQLTTQGKAIYDALVRMYDSGMMEDGRTGFDLAGSGVSGAADQYAVVSQDVIEAYRNGNRTLFNDFAAAKDAFDLEHPDAWYVDSSYLTLRVTKDGSGALHAYMGAGRANYYHLDGETIADVDARDAALNAAVKTIVDGARAISRGDLSAEDYAARQVQYVHDAVTHAISYRYEIDCSSADAAKYIRTVYALVTHEGVCESYSRSMQLILGKLGIPCVLIHGMQTAGGDPEPHMWNAVQIGGKWYAVDATWDDPVRLDSKGAIIKTGIPGEDGGEIDNYLLVGQDVIGQNWQPSGVVSIDGAEFRYPDVELRSYNGDSVYQDAVGLHVAYTAASEMEGEDAGQWTVDFRGEGVEEAAEDGFYFLVKMWDTYGDGTEYKFDEWYYVEAGLIGSQGNEFFKDTPSGVVLVSATCEYAQFAVTTRAPDYYFDNWSSHFEPTMGKCGYYQGDGLDIIAETDMLYNPQSDYAAPPYVKTQYPAANTQNHIGQTYRMQVTYDDKLYAPDKAPSTEDWSAPDNINGQAIRVSYTTWQPDQDYDTIPVDLAGTVNFDTDHTGCVQSADGKWQKHYVDSALLEWHWACPENHIHTLGSCPVDGVSFDFAASTDWSDDLTLYSFQIEGLVGSRSGKRPNEWGVVMATPYCPICYRSQGIDWNLWGRPFLLDNPDDLDLEKIKVQGTDGSQKSLAELDDKMSKNGYNGKLTLTVEDISKSRPKSQEVTEALESKANVDLDAIQEKLMYEISFTRICKMMVLEPGQKLRVSIGYPAGITYENLKDHVIRAYHFTRDEEGACEITSPDHEHTGEIIDVQELEVTPTPYGLVILCDSFSPFEIVALDPDMVEPDHYELTKNVVVATDGNGEVLVNGKKAVGENGLVQFGSGADSSHTFTLKPEPGYVLDTVTYGGTKHIDASEIALDQSTGTYSFTLTDEDVVDQNDILNVTFVPAAIQKDQSGAGQTTVTPEACPHHNTVPIGEDKAPTCTETGTAAGIHCNDCGQDIKAAETLPATGHHFAHYRVTHAATCTADGEEVGFCSDCSEGVDIRVIPATGHSFGSYRVTHAATCTEDGEEVRFCAVCNEPDIRVIPAGHLYGEDGVCTRCGQRDPETLSFPDVDKDAWYFGDVQFAYQHDLMDGTDKGFEPGSTASRAQVVTVLWRIAGEPKAKSGQSFPDVPAGLWYTEAVKWASDNDIVKGDDNGLFKPNANVTREQLVTFLHRFAKYCKKDVSAADGLTGFSDAASVSDWALDAVKWACGSGILNGKDGRIDPAGTAQRCEMAALLHRLCDKYSLI